jgi:hypothetical protein
MSRGFSRRWWSGQWLLWLLGIIGVAIAFRYGTASNWSWLNFLNQGRSPYQTISTGVSVVPASLNAGTGSNTLRPGTADFGNSGSTTPMPPTDGGTGGANSPNNPNQGTRALW